MMAIVVFRMYLLFVLVSVLSLVNCYGRGVSSGVSALIESSNNFGFLLYSKNLNLDKNLVFSPWSISTGLAMLYLGARNHTAREMEAVQYENEDGVPAREMMIAYGQLDRLMERKSGLELTKFNAAVVQQGSVVSETYKHRLFHYFNSVLYDLDMAHNGKLVRDWINILAEIKTNGLIKNILAKAPTADSKLLLLNGLYYKGEWVEKFDPSKTAIGSFHNYNGATSSAAMMLSTSNFTYRYSHLDNVHVVRLPLNGKFGMTFVMPGENATLEEVAETLNFKLFNRIVEEDASPKTIKLSLPRFKLEERRDLSDSLEKIGLRSLFSPMDADLSGIDESRSLFLKDVVHKATVEVNEEGVEAAATTILGVESRLGAPYVVFNRPFMFFVQDLDTRLILFMGHLVDCTDVCGVSKNYYEQQSL